MQKLFTYLALGDSYTIGEALPITHSFPYQTVELLRKAGHLFAAPEVVAKTGWTTDELQEGISERRFLPSYDFVSLLIGVNNQYRGREPIPFKIEFEQLLQQAIQFAGKPGRVAVLSIPDYSITPFAEKMNKEKIAGEIDVYNSICRAVSLQYKTSFIDITTELRTSVADGSLVASDGLHPSAKAYSAWAQKLFACMAPTLL